jgi:uncharacterized membrane protein
MAESTQDKDIEEGKFFAVISYISFLCIVALVLKKDNKFALYHAKHGLVLFVMQIVSFILSIIPILGWLIRTIGLAVFILASLWGIFKALRGEYYRFPIVSGLADKIVL